MLYVEVFAAGGTRIKLEHLARNTAHPTIPTRSLEHGLPRGWRGSGKTCLIRVRTRRATKALATKKLTLGGFTLTVLADSHGIAIAASYDGKWWSRLVKTIRARRLASVKSDPTGTTVDKQDTSHGSPDSTASATNQSSLARLRADVNGTYWYHTFDFGDGIITNGQFDHGAILERYRLPDDLAGKRVLDIATFDGFWAFEFEKRGASEVIALDVEGPADCDFPPTRKARATEAELQVKFGRGFEIARRQLDSRVDRRVCNVYDLSPDTFGMFDVVHSGDLLPHLHSPVRALQNIASVCSEYALISEVYAPGLDILGSRNFVEYRGGHEDVSWWSTSLSALENMIEDAGFSRVELLTTFRYGPRGMPETMHHAVFKAYR